MIDSILVGVLWGCIITMLITLHRLGKLIDKMLDSTKVIRINLDDIMNGVQKKIKQETEIDDFIDELNKKHKEENNES